MRCHLIECLAHFHYFQQYIKITMIIEMNNDKNNELFSDYYEMNY